MDEDQTSWKTLAIDTYDNLERVDTIDEIAKDHIEGKNGPTSFLPLNTKIVGQTRNTRDEDRYLMSDQARYIYKMVWLESVINLDTIKQKIDQDIDKIDDTSSKISPYHEIIHK